MDGGADTNMVQVTERSATKLLFKVPESLFLAPVAPITGGLGALPNEVLTLILESVGHGRPIDLLRFIMSCRTTMQLYAGINLEVRALKPQSFSCLFFLQTMGPGAGNEEHWSLCYFCSQFVRKDANAGRTFMSRERREHHDHLMQVSDFYWGWRKMGSETQVGPSMLCIECQGLLKYPMPLTQPQQPMRPWTLPWVRRPIRQASDQDTDGGVN